MQLETPTFSVNLEAIRAADDFDCAWVRVEVHAGGFTGNFEAFLQTCDLDCFSKALGDLYENVGLPGTASLIFAERGVVLSMAMEKNGSITGEYEFFDDSVRTTLSGSFTIDQSYIPEWRKRVEALAQDLRTHGS
jgi:hypothetical protein